MASEPSKLKITLVKSTISSLDDQIATVRALGLRRIRHSVIREDCPAIRGMIFKVRHLVDVQEIK